LLAVTSAASISAHPQTHSPRTPAAKPPWKRYCSPEADFCFKYPSTWSILGEIFAGNGVVVAPPQKQDRALWNAITVAMVVPSPKGDEEPLGLDGVIEQAESGLRERGQDFETEQRQQRTVDKKPAQLLKVRYHENATDRDWVEEMAFIDGPDGEIYSVALKCAPENLTKLDPIFARVLSSWTLPEPEPPANTGDEDVPQKPAAPPKRPSSAQSPAPN